MQTAGSYDAALRAFAAEPYEVAFVDYWRELDLVLIRQDALGDVVGRIQLIVAKLAKRAARLDIASGFRDGLHLHADRAHPRDVVLVGDDLEFGNRLPAEL